IPNRQGPESLAEATSPLWANAPPSARIRPFQADSTYSKDEPMVRTLRPTVLAALALPALALVALLVFSRAARQERSPPKKSAPPGAEVKEEPKKAAGPQIPKYTSVRKLPGSVTLATLSNGLTVIVQENHVAPVATVRCYVKNTGSAFEGKN